MTRFISLLIIAPLTLVAPVALADDTTDDDVKLEALPKPVRDTVQREVKNGRITQIEREDDLGPMFFEVEFIENNQRIEIHVAPDGKLLQRRKD